MRLVAAQGRHLDRGALDRLGDRDRHLHLEVVALALEDRGLRDAGDHVEVARRPTARPGLALALQPTAAPSRTPAGMFTRVALDLPRLARAVAGRARVLDLGAGAAALAARLRDREEPLRLRLDAAPLAAAADRRGGSGLRAGAVAGGAGSRERHGHGDLAALHRLLERHVNVGLEVAPALRSRRSPGAPALPKRSERMSPKPPKPPPAPAPPPPKPPPGKPAAEDPAAGVVLLALLGVGQDRVRALDLLEALLGRRSPGFVSGWYLRASLR